MATVTLATNAVLTAVPFTYGMPAADVATVGIAIRRDSHNPSNNQSTSGPGTSGPQPPIGTAFIRSGLLIVPERGVLRLYPGDYVGVDSTGWPILVSARAAATAAAWTHT